MSNFLKCIFSLFKREVEDYSGRVGDKFIHYVNSISLIPYEDTYAYVVIEDTVVERTGSTNRAFHVYDSESYFKSEYSPLKRVKQPWRVWKCGFNNLGKIIDSFPEETISFNDPESPMKTLKKYKQYHSFRFVK